MRMPEPTPASPGVASAPPREPSAEHVYSMMRYNVIALVGSLVSPPFHRYGGAPREEGGGLQGDKWDQEEAPGNLRAHGLRLGGGDKALEGCEEVAAGSWSTPAWR